MFDSPTVGVVAPEQERGNDMGLVDAVKQSSKTVVAIDPLHAQDLPGNPGKLKMAVVRVRTKDGREINMGPMVPSYTRTSNGPRLVQYDTVYVFALTKDMYSVVRDALVEGGYEVLPPDQNYRPTR
jgi:hypothetical protein